MKKLAVAALLLIALFYAVPDSLKTYLSWGEFQYGISGEDPLGKPAKLHAYLTGSGFEGEPGESGKEREVSYTHPYDSKLYPDWNGALIITIGEEEYIQSIKGVFVGSQHGYTPQRRTMVEDFLQSLWKRYADGKPKFERVKMGELSFPFRLNPGKKITITETEMRATFETDAVKGVWRYSERFPMELIEISLK